MKFCLVYKYSVQCTYEFTSAIHIGFWRSMSWIAMLSIYIYIYIYSCLGPMIVNSYHGWNIQEKTDRVYTCSSNFDLIINQFFDKNFVQNVVFYETYPCSIVIKRINKDRQFSCENDQKCWRWLETLINAGGEKVKVQYCV